jgi:hypothetical protein
VLHHPLHLGHLAAAAASGFGATSADFLGKRLFFSNLLQRCPSWEGDSRSAGKKFPDFYESELFIQTCVWFVTSNYSLLGDAYTDWPEARTICGMC